MISGGGRFSRGQVLAVAGVVVVVVGLFGFMAVNSRSSSTSSEATASGSSTTVASTTTSTSEVDEAPAPTAAPMPQATTTTEPPPTADPAAGDSFEGGGTDLEPGGDGNPDFPVDQARFCAGTRGIVGLERAFSASFAANDLEGIRRAVADHRDAWSAAATDLVEAGAPNYRSDFERYRDVYIWLLTIVDTDGDLPRIANGYPVEYRDRSTNPADAIANAADEHCR